MARVHSTSLRPSKGLQNMATLAVSSGAVKCRERAKAGIASQNTSCRYIVAKLYSLAGTGYIYHKRRLRIAPKLEMVKYDPLGTPNCTRNASVRAHVLFTESKPAIPENFHLKPSAK